MPNESRATYQLIPPLSDQRRLEYFNRFAKERYGDFSYIDRKSLNRERDGEWVIMGGISRPYEINDVDSKFCHVRYDIVPEAFSIQLTVDENDANVRLRGISRNELKRIVEKRIRGLTSKYEAIILDNVKDRLAQIPQIQASHTPIILIIQNLNDIFDRKIDLTKREYVKWGRYLPLFEDLEIIRPVGESMFTMGEAYKQFEKLLANADGILLRHKLVEELFGYVIMHGSQYLSQYLNLTATKPYIGLTSTFYRYASKLGRNFSTTVEDLFAYYKEFYRRTLPISRFRYWVSQLEKVEILNYSLQNRINGNEKILANIQSSIKKAHLAL